MIRAHVKDREKLTARSQQRTDSSGVVRTVRGIKGAKTRVLENKIKIPEQVLRGIKNRPRDEFAIRDSCFGSELPCETHRLGHHIQTHGMRSRFRPAANVMSCSRPGNQDPAVMRHRILPQPCLKSRMRPPLVPWRIAKQISFTPEIGFTWIHGNERRFIGG